MKEQMSGFRQHEKIIEDWMKAVIHDGGIDRYDDLHIDKIDKSWTDSRVWVDAAFEAIRVAVAVRDQLKLDFTVAIAWSLKTDEESPVEDFMQRRYLESQANWSPPSLYLFHRGREPWTQIDIRTSVVQRSVVKHAGHSITAANGIKYWCYMEFNQGDQLSRSVFGLG